MAFIGLRLTLIHIFPVDYFQMNHLVHKLFKNQVLYYRVTLILDCPTNRQK